MKKAFVIFIVLSVLPGVVCASDNNGLFPPAHELFKPLLADPRELQYALRLVLPVDHTPKGEAALGDYLGVYRWSLGRDRLAQISFGGGVFGRFELAADSNALQVADYYGNTVFDFRGGPWSTRFMLFHTSSHLGDDYLKAHGGSSEKHTWDNMRFITSYDAYDYLRLYGGYTYAFRTLPSLKRHALQSGFEMYSPWSKNGHMQLYWANDVQSWSRNEWNLMFNSQLGLRVAKTPDAPRGASIFVEFGSGRMPYGQFFQRKESHWTLGVKFYLS